MTYLMTAALVLVSGVLVLWGRSRKTDVHDCTVLMPHQFRHLLDKDD